MFNKFAFIVVSIITLIAFRLLPHLPNMSPLLSVSLFSGLMFDKPWAKCIVPFVALIITDLILGAYASLPYTYFAIGVIILLGSQFRNHTRLMPLLKASLGASMLFYLISNFGVWAHSAIYSKSISDLAACYVAGIPFLQNTLVSTLFFSSLFYITLMLFNRVEGYLAIVLQHVRFRLQ